MPNEGESDRRALRFWPLVGIVLVIDLLITAVYVLLNRGFSGESWSNALCTSSVILGAASGIPFLFDAGRGLSLVGKMGSSEEERREALAEERRRRETGMTITFALALVAFITGLISLLASLW